MRVLIASDHAGFEMKKALVGFLKEKGYDVVDLGPYEYDAEDDFVDYAEKLCRKLLEEKESEDSNEDIRGVLICGSGQGMCIAANKFPGIYAAQIWDERSARIAVEHDNANVACLAGRFLEEGVAKKTVEAFLHARFGRKEKRIRRVEKIKKLEREFMKRHGCGVTDARDRD